MILMSLLEVLSDVKSIWINPKHVFALNKIAINENAAWTLNCANQYIVNIILANSITGNASPKKASIQKW